MSERSPHDDLTYEQARAELESVVRSLDNPELPLEEMMTLWERGEALASLCERRLEGARERFDAVTRAADGLETPDETLDNPSDGPSDED